MSRYLLIPWILGLFYQADGYPNANPNLLFATAKEIRVTSRSHPKGQIIFRDIEEATGMSFCYERGIVCWSDRHREMLQCAGYNGSFTGPKEAIVKSDAGTPEGVACDWVTGKLYWTDGESNRIEVISLDTKHRKVLFWDDIDQPRAIALVPRKRFFFWTDWGEVPKIERAGMDGSNGSRVVIVNEDIFWPNGLTIDFDNELVYWSDGKLKFLAVVDYNGGRRRKIINAGVDYPYGVAFFRNKLYWTDWESWSIFELALNATTQAPRKIFHTDHALTDVRIYDPLRQPPMTTPCSVNNGGCSHLCLLSPGPQGYSCACPTGIKLIDPVTCANGSQEFLIVVQRMDISKISLDSPDYTIVTLPLHGLEYAIAVDYDPVKEEIYWTDQDSQGIRKATIRGMEQRDVIITDVETPDGIAVDWISRNLFWTDTGTDRIEVSNLKGQYRKVLINRDLLEPRGIAVAPEQGLIFWSDWNEERPKIERANMDGSDRRLLAEEHLAWPNGIALDRQGERLFWCDAKMDKIESCAFDGSDRREVISDHLFHPFGLSHLGDYLYWTDWSQRTVERVNKMTNKREIIAEQIANIMAVCAVRITDKLGWNPCADNNGGCNHLCLNRPNNNYICACQIEYELTQDMKTCVQPEAFLLFARERTIGSISIENNNNDNKTIPVTNLVSPSGLDLDRTTGRIYWADSGLRSITRAFLNGSDVERIIEVGIATPTGVAVDWVSKNLYWADQGSRRIEVARLNGNSRRVLLWNVVEQPMSIALDPLEGYMYWTDWGKLGVVMRAGMDGSGPQTLVSSVGRATGLTIDHSAQRMYWASAGPTIETANLDGSSARTLISSGLTKPSSLAFFQDRLYWSDWETGVIETANKTTGQNRSSIQRGLRQVADIIVYQVRGKNDRNACSVRNGGCTHLCLPKPNNTFTCQCPLHHTLAKDNRTCHQPTSFLLFSQRSSIHRLVPETTDCPDVELPVQGLKGVRAIEFDPGQNLLYWIDGRSSAIKSSLESSGKAQTVVQVQERNLNLYDLALEPFSQLLFWTCSSSDVINVTRVDIPNRGVDTIIHKEGFKPRDLAVHSRLGYVLWTDVAGKGRLVRARLDGSNITVLVKDLREISAITVDQLEDRIFFAYDRQIDVCDMDGRQRRSLVRDVEAQNLALQGPLLFWVGRKAMRGVECALKSTGNERRVVLNRVEPTDLIAVSFPMENVTQQHPCFYLNKPSCSHICLPVEVKEDRSMTLESIHYDKSEYFSDLDHDKSYREPVEDRYVLKAKCACPLHQMLESDGKSCIDMPDCPQQFVCSGLKSSSNKECIPAVWRCDGQRDCPDGSDERGCPTCGADEFRCLNAECIDKAGLCDHVNQCSDGSDEAQCCQHNEFYCSLTGLCVPENVLCDGWDHCGDRSDESPEVCLHRDPSTVAYPDKGVSSYVIAGCVVLLCAFLLAGCSYYRRKLALIPDASGESAGGLLAPKPFQDSSSLQTPRTQETALRMSAFNSSTSSYDRNHITGASSSSTSKSLSCGGMYPAETLNPPPSPATVRTDSRRCCASAGDARSYRPYRHYRAINQPPPPTPCETDVCDESDYGSVYRPQTESEYMSYSRGTASECDSDPFPPPPTPSSCPPSPSSTYWNPLPPPPSPVSRHHH